jgi:Glycosyl hydrolase 2 galactose-binding domain-like
VPPGTRALRLPSTLKFRAVYLNGKPITTTTDGRVELGRLDGNHPKIIALVTSAADELEDDLEFEAGKSTYQLGSWTWTGLSSFSGEASYEKSFRLEPNLEGKRIELDLGRVGVTAEVWVNGKRVGERVWEPYRQDVTEYLHAGENHLRIAVTNSDSNRRAEADPMRYMERKQLPGGGAVVYMDTLSLNGLLGPVQLVPYDKVDLRIPQ